MRNERRGIYFFKLYFLSFFDKSVLYVFFFFHHCLFVFVVLSLSLFIYLQANIRKFVCVIVLRRYFNSTEIGRKPRVKLFQIYFNFLDKMDDFTGDDELYTLVCQGDLPNELDSRLKTSANVDEILMFLYRRDNQCVSLLMLAALHGHDEMIRVLLSHSSDMKTLVELTGSVHRANKTLVRNATALWCACDRGHYTVARTLIEVGQAKIDHGPRYPLLVDAVVMGRLDIVRFLIENRYATITRTGGGEHFRLNSLMMGVIYGQTQIVAYLLENGSQFDYSTSTSSNTPLGYACIKGHLDIVRLLCLAGACSTLKNRNGQTPLMLAAKYDRMHVVDYLLDLNDCETGIKELELVACSFITPVSNNITILRAQSQRMISLMCKIFELRTTKNISKTVAEPIAAYSFQQECQTIEELNKIEHDNERLYIEALLIRERLLVPEKDETLFKPLLIRGDKLVKRGQFELCLHLWEHTFHLYQNMNIETGLHRFVWLFCKMLSANIPISPQQFVQICRLTFEPSQQKAKDDYIKNAVCFLAIAVKVLEQPALTKTECQLIYQWISDVCRQKRTTRHEQTLLHLCVDVQTYNDINYRANDIKPILT
jgi:ankyrin repeat protein